MENYEFFNANPRQQYFKNGKPKIYNGEDGIVRAISALKPWGWETSYKYVCSTAMSVYDMPNSKTGIAKIMQSLGYDFVNLGKPNKNENRPVVSEVAKLTLDNDSLIMCNCAGHVVACKNGKYYDAFDSGNMSVYSYYIKK